MGVEMQYLRYAQAGQRQLDSKPASAQAGQNRAGVSTEPAGQAGIPSASYAQRVAMGATVAKSGEISKNAYTGVPAGAAKAAPRNPFSSLNAVSSGAGDGSRRSGSGRASGNGNDNRQAFNFSFSLLA